MAGLNPPRKRRRTSDVPATLALLHRIKQSMPRISATAFASMCQFAQHMALPNCDHNMVRKARDEVLGQDTPFGALIRKVPVKDHKGNIINISISHPIPFFLACGQDDIPWSSLRTNSRSNSINASGALVTPLLLGRGRPRKCFKVSESQESASCVLYV